jgi:hypothetical protein
LRTLQFQYFASNCHFIRFENLDRGRFVFLHEAAEAGDVGAEDGGELAVEAFLLHGGTSALLKVHHVAKGSVSVEKGTGRAEMKLSSVQKGKVVLFLKLNISQLVGGKQEESPIVINMRTVGRKKDLADLEALSEE